MVGSILCTAVTNTAIKNVMLKGQIHLKQYTLMFIVITKIHSCDSSFIAMLFCFLLYAVVMCVYAVCVCM